MITWWMLSIIASFFLAGFVYYNQIAKLPSHILMMYRGFGVAIIMFPICYIIGIPKLHYMFYVLSIIQGISIGYLDNRFFRASKVFGAEITGSLQPIALGLTFILWLFIKPSNFFELIDNPIKFVIISACIVVVILSVMLLKKAKANKKAILYLLPCIVLVGFADPIIKIIMNYGEGQYIITVCLYTAVSALFAGLYNVFVFKQKKGKIKDIVKSKTLKHGFVIMFFLIGLVFFKGNAIALSPNPAYVVSVIYLSPIWIACFNYLYTVISKKKVKNKVNKKIMLTLVASVITLILVTR